MSNLTISHHSQLQHELVAGQPRDRNPAGRAAGQPRTSQTIERAVERTRIRTVIAICVGVIVVSFLFALFLAGGEEAALLTTGIGLTAFLFGLPFWIAAIDAQCEGTRDTLSRKKRH
ncbi:MAG: hypothetical protein ACR2GY_12565 [Phycisphaerales bacterium]